MMLLLDVGPTQLAQATNDIDHKLKLGQLITPLTRYSDHGLQYAIDNGAFSSFDSLAFLSLLDRQSNAKDRCLFVVVPDIVGSARRTSEVFHRWKGRLAGWPLAYVAQDGSEDLDIPWDDMAAVFIGGSTSWKCSSHAIAIIKTAKALGRWAHVGRVNTPSRFDRFAAAGADSCDGSGISRFSWMRQSLTSNGLFSEPATVTPLLIGGGE